MLSVSMFVRVATVKSIPAAVVAMSPRLRVSIPSPPSRLSNALKVESAPLIVPVNVSSFTPPVKSAPSSISVVKVPVYHTP